MNESAILKLYSHPCDYLYKHCQQWPMCCIMYTLLFGMYTAQTYFINTAIFNP